MRKTKNLDLNARYVFPSELKAIHYDGRIIIVAPTCLAWIVLDNENQYHFFKLLQSYTIAEAIAKAGISEADVRNTLTQIEARSFSGCNEAKVDTSENSTLMQFFLTDGCNLRCPHCLMKATVKGENELSTEEVLATLSAYKNNGGEVVTFSGGEIAMRSDLVQIISHCRSLGLQVGLLTNGTLWDESLINKVASSLARVQVSVDGFSEATNARIRGKGNFEKSLRTVDLFTRAGVKVEIAVTPMLTDSLEQEAPLFVAWAKELKELYKDYDFNIRFTTELIDGRDVSLTNDEQERYGRIMKSVYDGVFGPQFETDAFVRFVKAGEQTRGCSYGTFNVTANGDVYLCGRVAGMRPMANIRKDDYEEIFQNLRKLTRLSCAENLTPCKDCELRYFCGGECRIKYFDAFKDLDNLHNLPSPSSLRRKCPQSFKDHYYRLMLDTNTRLFS